MSYAELRRLNVTFRPIDSWPGELTRSRRRSQFSASLPTTIGLVARELGHLRARQIVLQIAVREDELRLDGIPYANAVAAHPGVILAFESKHGPLKYAVDTFTTWQDNLRAVGLALEALRKVDRYGVTRRGEQYTGWRAIPQRTGDFQSREQAQLFIDEHGGYRAAARKFHPDNQDTGDEEMFKRLQAARELTA